jgi:hypothetical protein
MTIQRSFSYRDTSFGNAISPFLFQWTALRRRSLDTKKPDVNIIKQGLPLENLMQIIEQKDLFLPRRQHTARISHNPMTMSHQFQGEGQSALKLR